jgi:two-component system sensor histidine kinase UhpB
VLLLQTILIIALLLQSARRRKAEALARRAEAALRISYDQVQDLARRLNTAQEVERARIARELHDDINQQLAVVAIRLSDLNRRIPDNELRSRVEWLQQRAGILIETVRSMSHDLHPGILQQAGLIAALRGVCSRISTEHGLVVDMIMPEEFPDIPAATALGIFRIAQEALTNVARHARAQRAELRLRHDAGWIQLEISDDGSGFQSNVSGKPGLGTLSMQERARLLGGELLIGNAAGGGTHVLLRVPLTVPETRPETTAHLGASGQELLSVPS